MKSTTAWAAVLSLLGTACASTPDGASHPLAREVAFDCSHGESLSVRFQPAQGVAVLLRHGSAVELPQQPSASGFLYSNGPITLRGKGTDLTVEIGRMVPIQCKAR